jgi:hypothetical protein
MAQPDPRPARPNPPLPMAILVIGITLNSLGVILVALRGIGWLGFSVMAIGLALLVAAVVMLISASRATPGHATGERDG